MATDRLERIERKLQAAEADGHLTLTRLVRDYIEDAQRTLEQLAAEAYTTNDHMQHRVRRALTKHNLAVRVQS